MNFEDPQDKDSISTMTFGSFDYGQVEGGENGLNEYLNVGHDNWSILMDDVKYGDSDIQ